MLTMKKDMGGAAHVLGLAAMVMAAQLPVRVRVLVPAVENEISGDAFRPGDVLGARTGKTRDRHIGNACRNHRANRSCTGNTRLRDIGITRDR